MACEAGTPVHLETQGFSRVWLYRHRSYVDCVPFLTDEGKPG